MSTKDWRLLHYASKSLPSTKTLAAFDLRSRPSIVVAERTRGYHSVVRSHVQPTDVVLEIGSAYGDCLEAAYLRCKEATYIGVDISEEAVLESRARFPHIKFEQVDVVQNPDALKELAKGATLIAIDINGNRAMASVLLVLASVEKILAPDIVVIKSSELFTLGRKHMKEADGGGSGGSSSGLVTIPNFAGWQAKLAQEALTQKACEHCKRQLCYKPKFSIVWESVRWCGYNCKVEATGGTMPCDNTNLLLNNKKYEQLVGLRVPNSMAEKNGGVSACADASGGDGADGAGGAGAGGSGVVIDGAADTGGASDGSGGSGSGVETAPPAAEARAAAAGGGAAERVCQALQPFVGKSLGSAVRVWNAAKLGRGCCGAEAGDKQVILSAARVLVQAGSHNLQLDVRFETWGMVEKTATYLIEHPTGCVTAPEVSISGSRASTRLHCDGLKVESPAGSSSSDASIVSEVLGFEPDVSDE